MNRKSFRLEPPQFGNAALNHGLLLEQSGGNTSELCLYRGNRNSKDLAFPNEAAIYLSIGNRRRDALMLAVCQLELVGEAAKIATILFAVVVGTP